MGRSQRRPRGEGAGLPVCVCGGGMVDGEREMQRGEGSSEDLACPQVTCPRLSRKSPGEGQVLL